MAIYPAHTLFPSHDLALPIGTTLNPGNFPTQDIPVAEEFNNLEGQFLNYDCYSVDQRDQIILQKHIDIRTFVASDVATAYRMGDLDNIAVANLDILTMQSLESGVVLNLGEQWTAGIVDKQADRNNWRGLTFTCSVGDNTTQSVMTPLDIDSGFTDNDFISLALPSFPLNNLDLTQCFIDFTSETNGDFLVGPTDSIAFTSAVSSGPFPLLLSQSGLTNGDSELRFPRGFLQNVNRSKVTGVRIRLHATVPCVFKCLAIRLLSQDWKYAPVDINTQLGILERPVSLTGAPAPFYYFPSTSIPTVPSDFPILFRASDPPGNADPRPVDSHFALSFNTGTMATNTNKIRLFFRERSLVPITQLNLDATDTTVTTQAQLDALGRQPDYGINQFAPRVQDQLDDEVQSELDNTDQSNLERVPDYHFATWLEVSVTWNNSGATLFVGNQAGDGYSYNFSVDSNQDYLILVKLIENSFTINVFSLDQIGQLLDEVFTTGEIEDDFTFKRRKGRVGWYASLNDGDAAINSIRTRGLVFAEAKFAPLTSITPVVGASLTASYSPDRQLFTSFIPSPWGGTFQPDASKSNSGNCFKVTNLGLETKQGIATNLIYFDDWENTVIEFDLLFPSSAAAAPLSVFLYGEFRLFLLNLGVIEPDVFQKHKITVPADNLQTGPYNIVFIQPNLGVNTVWWIDNLKVRQRVVSWEGRGFKDNAWGDTRDAFIPFKDTINYPQGAGILFEAGNTPQVRVRALKQNATISKIQVQPKYAQLGRFIWPEDAPVNNLIPTPSLQVTQINSKIVCDSSLSFESGGNIIASHWDLGDGTQEVGPRVIHEYANSGIYTVTLTVIDVIGNRASISQTVTV